MAKEEKKVPEKKEERKVEEGKDAKKEEGQPEKKNSGSKRGKGSKGNKGKGNRKPNSPKEEKKDEKDFTGPRAKNFDHKNDSGWYKVDETYTKNVANIPFSIRTGDNFTLTGPNNNGSGKTSSVARGFPGIMVLRTIPNFSNAVREFSTGQTTLDADAVNTAANGLYAYVRSAQSGSKNYEKADLELLMMAEGELIAAFSMATMVYGTVQHYSPINKYQGKAILNAMHIDYDDIVANLPQYRASLNILLRKASVITVPELDYFKRKFWLYSGIHSDDEDVERGQYYVFEPIKLLKYEADYFTTGTSLGPVSKWKSLWTPTMTDTTIKWRDIIDTLTEMVDALVYDDDVALMSGDIRKAFNPDNLFSFWQINEDYETAPYYTKEALMQIHNAAIVSAPTQGGAINFYTNSNGGDDATNQGDTPTKADFALYLSHGPFQVDNTIYGNALVQRTAASSYSFNPNTSPIAECDQHYLSCEELDPSVDTILESTRLMCKTQSVQNNSSFWRRIVCLGGTEVVYDVDVYFYEYNGTLSHYPCAASLSPTQYSNDIITALISAFHDHPLFVTTVTTTLALSGAAANYRFWNMETVTLIPDLVLEGIHNSAFFGMFVPKESFIASNNK